MKHRSKLLKLSVFLCIIFLCGIFFFIAHFHKESQNNRHTSTRQPVVTSTIPGSPSPEVTSTPSEVIYSFSQGPKAWKTQKAWSGSWANVSIDGNVFGNFGCGFCCMANIYSTLTPYVCSPLDIYRCAKKHAPYYPTPGIGAIDWNAMQQTLEYCGFSCALKNKTLDYEEFQKAVADSKATLILVSSSYSDRFWKNTSGHYVTLWNYNENKDTVFLTDPGDPKRNRRTIALQTAYDALKMTSLYQYMLITDYNENQNQWCWNEISEDWIAP